MADLGPGTRFSVGWAPDVPELFGQLGTVLKGPYDWREAVELSQGPLIAAFLIAHHKHTPFTYWEVRLDNGRESYLAEQLIIPIDGSDDEANHDTERRTPTTAGSGQ